MMQIKISNIWPTCCTFFSDFILKQYNGKDFNLCHSSSGPQWPQTDLYLERFQKPQSSFCASAEAATSFLGWSGMHSLTTRNSLTKTSWTCEVIFFFITCLTKWRAESFQDTSLITNQETCLPGRGFWNLSQLYPLCCTVSQLLWNKLPSSYLNKYIKYIFF